MIRLILWLVQNKIVQNENIEFEWQKTLLFILLCGLAGFVIIYLIVMAFYFLIINLKKAFSENISFFSFKTELSSMLDKKDDGIFRALDDDIFVCPECNEKFPLFSFIKVAEIDRATFFSERKLCPHCNAELKICPNCLNSVGKDDKNCPVCTKALDSDTNENEIDDKLFLKKYGIFARCKRNYLPVLDALSYKKDLCFGISFLIFLIFALEGYGIIPAAAFFAGGLIFGLIFKIIETIRIKSFLKESEKWEKKMDRVRKD